MSLGFVGDAGGNNALVLPDFVVGSRATAWY